jgi:hypothetical protein
VGDVSQSLKQEVQERFVVGPVVDRDFYHAERATMSLDRGPWKTPLAYLRSIANREIAWLTHHAPGKPSADESDAQSTPSAHIDLYNRFLKVADHLLPAGELSKPTLWHPYLHTPNLFVTGDRITSVVDWQHACIRPLFLQSRRAPLVRYWGEKMLQLPDDFDTMADEAEQARVMDGVDSSIILQHYERATEAKNPTLHRVDQVPQRVERRATVASAGNTWDEDIVRLRQGLIRVARFVFIPPILYLLSSYRLTHKQSMGRHHRYPPLSNFLLRPRDHCKHRSRSILERCRRLLGPRRQRGIRVSRWVVSDSPLRRC